MEDEDEPNRISPGVVASPDSVADVSDDDDEEGDEDEDSEEDSSEEEVTVVSDTDDPWSTSDGEESVDGGGGGGQRGDQPAGQSHENAQQEGGGPRPKGVTRPEFLLLTTEKAMLQPGERLKAPELLPTEFPDKWVAVMDGPRGLRGA